MRNIRKIANSIMLQGSAGMLVVGLVPLFFKKEPFLDHTQDIAFTLSILGGFLFGIIVFRHALLKDEAK